MPEYPEHSADVYSADELGQYQAISLTAVLALFLGLLSPLAFLSPVLLITPLIALAVASKALSEIGAPNSGLSGARFARAGLVLAILFGVASCSRLVVSNLLESRSLEAPASVSRLLRAQPQVHV